MNESALHQSAPNPGRRRPKTDAMQGSARRLLIEHRSVPAFIVAIAILGGAGNALAWDAGPSACMHTDSSDCAPGRGNTHLWIVNNAIDLLAQSTDPIDRAIVAALNAESCRGAWERGLWEVDCSSGVPGCSGPETDLGDPPALGSHFYNANGKDYFGEPEECPTYLVCESCVFPETTARKNGAARLRLVDDLSSADSCRTLGQALHYFTDTTMPFHASGLSGVSLFLNLEHPDRLLHPTWENWVGSQHEAFPAQGLWQKDGIDGSADALFVLASTKSWTYLSAYFKAMELGRLERVWSESTFPATSGVLGEMLQSAYQATASYLYVGLRTRLVR